MEKEFKTLFTDTREKFKTGAVRNTMKGKGRYDLIPPEPLRRIAKVYERGAEGYGDRNWEKGIPFSRLFDSAVRHLQEWLTLKTAMRYNKSLEEVPGPLHPEEDHLAQAAWNILALMHFETYRPDLDDLGKGVEGDEA